MRQLGITVDQIIARLAARAHGVVARTALLDADVSEAEIRTRLARGALIRVHLVSTESATLQRALTPP